ncbi:hypothetical protein [Runella limosa]|uniref:hypothetical protein n=1 Tax=Runella limosa TaxID=370978 RepID=UPI00048BA5E8|nr:hypothetical protein [Runella limosa]
MKKTYQTLTLEQKRLLAKELYDYHAAVVQTQIMSKYSEKYNVGHRTFKEQIAERRPMRNDQAQFVIESLIPHTSPFGIRELFRRLFDAEPEAFGYIIDAADALALEESESLFNRWKHKKLLASE